MAGLSKLGGSVSGSQGAPMTSPASTAESSGRLTDRDRQKLREQERRRREAVCRREYTSKYTSVLVTTT